MEEFEVNGKIATDLINIEKVIAQNPDGLTSQEISQLLALNLHSRTLLRRLETLVENHKITRSKEKRAVKYYPCSGSNAKAKPKSASQTSSIFSAKSLEILNFLDTHELLRTPAAYNRTFLESYIPNETAYVPRETRERLLRLGLRFKPVETAEAYTVLFGGEIVVEFSYNSSRLEGNSYSRSETKKLLYDNITAVGKDNIEAIMILNHKEAFMEIHSAGEWVEPNALTIRGIHSLLAQDLLSDREAIGNLRKIGVRIGGSAYEPINDPHILKEMFDTMISKAEKISDPFELSFFLLVHLSYLQAFVDVNKRTSRVACNIPLFKRHLCPLSFVNVQTRDYASALISVYEKNELRPMLELYEWAYIQSCEEYTRTIETQYANNAYYANYRTTRNRLIDQIIIENTSLFDEELESKIRKYCTDENIPEQDKFVAMIIDSLELIMKHGKILGLQVSDAQIQSWIDRH